MKIQIVITEEKDGKSYKQKYEADMDKTSKAKIWEGVEFMQFKINNAINSKTKKKK